MKTIITAAGAIFLCLVIYFFIPSSYEIKNAVPAGETIICFGDSLTWGTGARTGMDYPSQLSEMIDTEVINAGIPGETTAGALKRIDEILEQTPGTVLITLGGNDLKNGIKRDIVFRNLELIIQKIQDKGALVVIGGIDIPFRGKNFARAYKDLAEKTGSVFIPDILEGIMGKPGMMSDMIHPNSKGYTIMAQHFYTALEPFL